MIINDPVVIAAVNKTNVESKDYTQLLVVITILRHVTMHPAMLSNEVIGKILLLTTFRLIFKEQNRI